MHMQVSEINLLNLVDNSVIRRKIKLLKLLVEMNCIVPFLGDRSRGSLYLAL